jgi:indolepyruvate ferredoxin oxidoreductase alpha subunit
MTGHQLNPGMGEDGVKIENIVSACGVKNIKIIDPVNAKEFEEGVKEFLAKEDVSVIIARHKCALLIKKQQV